MKHFGLFVCAIFAVHVLSVTDSFALESLKLEIKNGDTIAYIGSEFVEQDIKHNFLETALKLAHPETDFKFRNLGWAGDDPTGRARGYFGGPAEGYKRLFDELHRLKPTIVFIHYGTVGQNLSQQEQAKAAGSYLKFLGISKN